MSDPTSRAQALINRDNMQPHPEGGWYVELFRSEKTVSPDDGRSTRSALTTIHFLLAGSGPNGRSRLHRVHSDEVWHHLEGSPLELICLAPDMKSINRVMLGPDSPTYIIPADYWQAATTTGDFTLVACSVGPGFDFDDFAMASDLPDDEAMLRSNHPDLVDFL
ncbi:MAG: cupin domain-containing protein [Bacteroidetes bacterium]|nr:cupin domain-containing protein [Bacteroidota bacterium]MDA1334176.1 cupin domain-containing protein [Bacteroidota bacterium]